MIVSQLIISILSISEFCIELLGFQMQHKRLMFHHFWSNSLIWYDTNYFRGRAKFLKNIHNGVLFCWNGKIKIHIILLFFIIFSTKFIIYALCSFFQICVLKVNSDCAGCKEKVMKVLKRIHGISLFQITCLKCEFKTCVFLLQVTLFVEYSYSLYYCVLVFYFF